MRSPAPSWLFGLALVSLVTAGCSGGTPVASPTPSPTPSPTASPTPSPTPAPVDPLTGLDLVPGPVVAVKIDNGVLARPYHRGLRHAAVVYQELVEGGLTRFMAVYESRKVTSEVGPIRSARETDLDILRAYGQPALAFSGAQSGVLALVRAAQAAGQVRDASYDRVPSLYRLGERRRDARNFFAVPSALGKRVGGSAPRDIGWRFGATPVGTATATARVSFSDSSVVRVRFDAATGTWRISQGSRLVPVAPANVIIQYVTVKPSRFHDVNGQNSPLSVTTGSGRVTVLRDGVRVKGTWKRSGHGPTRLVDAAGVDLLLKPGPSFVMLLPRTRGVTYT